MADMQSPQHPLEVLPAMLNLVLLQTAKIFRDPECHNLKQAGLTKRRITEIVTVANQRFHDALDEIEVEILQAKAVLERDLRLIRKKRAEKDRANGLIANPSPPVETNVTVPAGAAADTDAMPMDVDTGSPKVTADPAILPTVPAPEVAEVAEPEKSDQEDITNIQGMPRDSENSMGLAITMPLEDAMKVQDQSTKPDQPVELAEDGILKEPLLEVPDAIDLDFESMFNDTDPTAIDDALNFDFNLSADASMAQEVLNDTSFNEVNISNAETINVPVATNEFESLLPGVENYLNADADFSDIAVPPVSSASNTTQAPVVTAIESSAQVPEEQAVAETSFDESFFSLGDLDMGENGGDELGDGTLGDFEDFDWTT